MLDERLLQVDGSVGAQPSIVVTSRPSYCTARARQEDPLAIDQHRAGPARALVAALLGAVQSEVFAQQVQQRDPVSVGSCSLNCSQQRPGPT